MSSVLGFIVPIDLVSNSNHLFHDCFNGSVMHANSTTRREKNNEDNEKPKVKQTSKKDTAKVKRIPWQYGSMR